MANTGSVVTTRVNENGVTEYHVLAVSDWNGFDTLIQYLKKHWGAVTLEFSDEIYSRRWVLSIKDVRISFYHDSQKGNYFLCEETKESSKIAEDIAADIGRRLA
jgi:hypothetical protein